MTIIDSIIPEVTKQCIEPISEQIANRLIMMMGWKNIFGNNIFLLSDDLQTSNFDDENHDKRVPNNRCDVTIIPGYNPLENHFEASRSRDTDIHLASNRGTFMDYPVFSDLRSHIHMFEVDVPCSVELQFSLKVKSVELSDMINVSLYSRYLTGGGVYDYNDIQFSYGIPDRFLLLLYKMYKMQDDMKAKYTFPEYLKICTNDSITTLVNRERLEAGGGEIILRRNNSKVLGKLEYSGDKHQTEDYNKVSNRYLIEFSYFYQFNKPAVLKLSYPIMIYNKLLDARLVDTISNMSYGEGDQIYPDRAVNLYFYRHNQAQIDLNKSYPLVRHPFYDDWHRSNAMYVDVNTKYQPLFIGLMSLLPDPATQTLTLSVDIKNEILPILKPEISAAFQAALNDLVFNDDAFMTRDDLFRRLGIFDLAVFREDSMIQYDQLELSSDLVLTVKSPTLHLANRYRVVISQVCDLRILNRVYVYYMLEHPEYYQDLLALHMQYLEESGFVKIIYDPFKDPQVKISRYSKQNLNQVPNNSIIINNYVIEVRRNRR